MKKASRHAQKVSKKIDKIQNKDPRQTHVEKLSKFNIIPFSSLSTHMPTVVSHVPSSLSPVDAPKPAAPTAVATGIKVAAACLNAFLSALPPSFCYKQGGDAGYIPTNCSSGFFRSAALCYQNCNAGYTFVLGVCWKNCDSGFTDTGSTCLQNCNSGYTDTGLTCLQNCSSGYRDMGLTCLSSCESGYTDTGLTCLQNCSDGYKDMGLTCFHWDWFHSRSYWKSSYSKSTYGKSSYGKKSIWKSSYIPSSYTNFDSRVQCNTGGYKPLGSALCYRDCANLGMSNCGIGACALDNTACAAGIVIMLVNIGMGFAEFVSFVVSLGLDTPAAESTNQAKAGVSNTANNASKDVQLGLQNVQKMAANSVARASFLSRVEAIAVEKLGSYVQTQTINLVCGSVGNMILNNVQGAKAIAFNPAALDPTGIASAVQNCQGPLATGNDQLVCAKSIMNAVSTIDPTGIVSIAAALVEPICDV